MLFHNKDDIQFVTEFPCFLGHPVGYSNRQALANRDTPNTNHTLYIYRYVCIQIRYDTKS